MALWLDIAVGVGTGTFTAKVAEDVLIVTLGQHARKKATAKQRAAYNTVMARVGALAERDRQDSAQAVKGVR